MLWDAVYSANNFRNGISVGIGNYSIHDVKCFTYSFVTVPSNKLITDKGKPAYTKTSTCVLRVGNLSGGNYWGKTSISGVAYSVKEMVERNLKHGHSSSVRMTLSPTIKNLKTTFKYFNLR